jgi:hypothetical protein
LATIVEYVHTIEQDHELFVDAHRALRDLPSVECHFGPANTVLATILQTIDEPVLFWLDAHWFPALSASDAPQCPLLSELDVLAQWPWTRLSAILIDDAHLFGIPPDFDQGARGYRPQEWPTHVDLVAMLVDTLRCRAPVVIDDILVVTPRDHL